VNAPEQIPEVEVVPEVVHGTEVAPATGAALAVAAPVQASDLVERMEKIEEAMDRAMKPDVDYGVIPGTNKPTLLKPGAEKLAVMFKLDVQTTHDERWGPGDHLTVPAYTMVYDAPTGIRLGRGEGLCTTRERKYAYRQQQRTCPHCAVAAVIKGKAEYGGGWLCFKKKGGCNAKWPDGDQAIEGQEVGEIENPDLPDLWNCVTPETRILTRDLRWVPAGDLKTGDVLVSVAEENRDAYGRPYQDATANVGEPFVDDLYELTMEDGRTVRCNGEHRWLVKAVNSGVEWVSTEVLHREISGSRTGRPRSWRILSMCAPWEPEHSVESGYVAGLLDADGSLDVGRKVNADGHGYHHHVGVSFAQQEGGVLERLTAALRARNFAYGEYPHGNAQMRAPVVKIVVRGGLFEQMRLLGTIRPPRLLERWEKLVDLKRRRFEGAAVRVESIQRAGRGELVRLGTSSHTYVAEGLLCHNTVIKMARKRAFVDAVLLVTGASALFTQDVELPSDEPAGTEAMQQVVAHAYGKPSAEQQIASTRAALGYLLGCEPNENPVGLMLNQIEVKGGYLPHFTLAMIALVGKTAKKRHERAAERVADSGVEDTSEGANPGDGDPAIETEDEQLEREKAEAIAAEHGAQA
jgi:hypothetical protein